jgi:hypothetical protein
MKPEIIKKFNLIKSNMNLARNFVNDICIYVDVDYRYFAMCDQKGNPLSLVSVFTKDGFWTSFTEEFLLDTDKESIHKIIDSKFTSQINGVNYKY